MERVVTRAFDSGRIYGPCMMNERAAAEDRRLVAAPPRLRCQCCIAFEKLSRELFFEASCHAQG